MYVVFIDRENATEELHAEEMDSVPGKGDFVNLTGTTIRQVIHVVWGKSENSVMMVVVQTRVVPA